jgi:MSHA biogenesis protein MshQ
VIGFTAGAIPASGARFQRLSPVSPFAADIALSTTVFDTDGVTTATAVAFGMATTGNGIAFNNGNAVRFGRLRLVNAFGPASGSLAMPVQAQYWSGSSWVLNSGDSCTTLPANAFFLSGGLAATTTASAVNLASGVGTLTLTKSTTATGSVDVAANLGTAGSDQSCLTAHGGTASSRPWLRSRNGSCATTYDRDPSARVTFGIYAPETRRTVHVRELF